jgi:hypothetical protein
LDLPLPCAGEEGPSCTIFVYTVEVYMWMGQPEQGIPLIKEAMRLNPYHPNWYAWFLGSAQYYARDYEGAVEFPVLAVPCFFSSRTLTFSSSPANSNRALVVASSKAHPLKTEPGCFRVHDAPPLLSKIGFSPQRHRGHREEILLGGEVLVKQKSLLPCLKGRAGRFPPSVSPDWTKILGPCGSTP